MNKRITLNQIRDTVDILRIEGPGEVEVSHVYSSLHENGSKGGLTWLSPKNISKLAKIQQGVAIIPDIPGLEYSPHATFIVVSDPRLSFAKIVQRFFTVPRKIGISASARIAADVTLGSDIFIGENVVIEENCVLGDRVTIDHGTIIKGGTRIGSDVTVGANSVIGGPGFGFHKDDQGRYESIPQIGSVRIEDDVYIGSGTCIDRAAMGETLIRSGARIDNLVHIAHGVTVGRNSVVIANAMIGGGTALGDDVWIGPSAAIMNKIEIGSGSLAGLGAVVIRSVAPNDIVAGNPAKSIKKQ